MGREHSQVMWKVHRLESLAYLYFWKHSCIKCENQISRCPNCCKDFACCCSWNVVIPGWCFNPYNSIDINANSELEKQWPGLEKLAKQEKIYVNHCRTQIQSSKKTEGKWNKKSWQKKLQEAIWSISCCFWQSMDNIQYENSSQNHTKTKCTVEFNENQGLYRTVCQI